jgi:hypothetical protein
MSVDRIYHCLYKRFLYRCPFDELGCNGTIAHCERHRGLTRDECISQKYVQNVIIPEQQAHVRMVVEHGQRLTYDSVNVRNFSLFDIINTFDDTSIFTLSISSTFGSIFAYFVRYYLYF